jgi:tetratricopeptide (TPR) repeat protein
MDNIIPFPAKQPSKFGFERVKKLKKEIPAQLDLISSGPGRILRLPTHLSPFEEALLLDEREDRRAEHSYRKAISEGDCLADAYCNLGIIESKTGRMTKAFDCFTKSLEHDPRHFESHYNLGNLYFEEDNLRLARMHYELAAEINPVFPNLCFNLGLVLALLDEKKAAIEAFLNYQRLAPPEDRKNADDLMAGLMKSLAPVIQPVARPSLLPGRKRKKR